MTTTDIEDISVLHAAAIAAGEVAYEDPREAFQKKKAAEEAAAGGGKKGRRGKRGKTTSPADPGLRV